MNEASQYTYGDLSSADQQQIDSLSTAFENVCRSNLAPDFGEYLSQLAEPALRPLLLRELLKVEIAWRRKRGERVTLDEYVCRLPDFSLVIAAVFTETLSYIGRYRVENLLGEGGFGHVYLAHDDELCRSVAIKVLRPERLADPRLVEGYRKEARTVASLDHPHIVPVHDVGSTQQVPFFIVLKYVDGTDLAKWLKVSLPALEQTIPLIATVAEALHYAHTCGLVHRDIKPANVLLDAARMPYVTDFGLALTEDDFGKAGAFAGTPAYMSPEQARGEGHRVDGRSDIFSLGSVFYEMLTGMRPFSGKSTKEVLEQICTFEACPPARLRASIPGEVERICLKALSKRAADRYATAKDMADDLRHFLRYPLLSSPSVTKESLRSQVSSSTSLGMETVTPEFCSQTVGINPKGLRAYDRHDADFFLELLPGSRDRTGLPESIRFWKSRIEEADPEDSFSVGLIYGPSGCGKSSLVKAGLLPRLSDDIVAIYVEATAEDTETRILNGLRKRCAGLSDKWNLQETMTALRRGQGIAAGKKVLLVLDQFEQWLHAATEDRGAELLQALRQCDCRRLQCILLVRDDFWMMLTRFLSGLEIDFHQGRNCAAIDLFDLDHAKKVLTAFGRALKKLPECGDISSEQQDFLNKAVGSLGQRGKLVCVRLTLFVEMMMGKAWTVATLKEVGGTERIGVTFLEEAFISAPKSPSHKMHREAAQAVLKALLPAIGTDIMGHMRSYDELLNASGYLQHSEQFDTLLRILDGELRLITPTDPGKTGDDITAGRVPAGKYYQLTHDYLVPALREWLTRKQKGTFRGRAEIVLEDRTAIWTSRPDKRHLATTVELLQIGIFTRWDRWTATQCRMLRRSLLVKSAFWSLLLATLLLMIFGARHIALTREARLHAGLDYEKSVRIRQECARLIALSQGKRYAHAVAGMESYLISHPADRLLQYDAACVYALAAKTLATEASSNAISVDPRIRAWKQKALLILRSLLEAGYFAASPGQDDIKFDPDLDSIRSEAGFIELVRSIGLPQEE
jgi:serine/threonine protein kinase